MDETYRINYREEPAWNIIGGGITEFNTAIAGEDNNQYLCFVVEGAEGEVVGGIIGSSFYGWLFIHLLWLRENLRRQGFGQRLLALAEEEARRRGARHAFLDTFSFQAPDFYLRHGYRVFGELPDFPPGHTRYYLTKEL